MASDYGLNFGFRRSDESMRSGTEGRQKVPAAGAFTQGDLVTFDPAAPGFIKMAAANDPVLPGFTGLLIQEDVWDIGIHENTILSSQDLDRVLNGRLCAIWTGAGLKVWMKNTPATAKPGQRPRAAVTKVVLTGVAIGDLLAWDGAKFIKAGTPAAGVARVTLVGSAGDYVEAVLVN